MVHSVIGFGTHLCLYKVFLVSCTLQRSRQQGVRPGDNPKNSAIHSELESVVSQWPSILRVL